MLALAIERQLAELKETTDLDEPEDWVPPTLPDAPESP
jgi:hypothetical protein